jgi:hypothetical protein
MFYAQEAPGVEILQGPYNSLAFRTVDCDDASILFASLTRAVGLQTYMAGVCSLEDPETLLHAVGYHGQLGNGPGIHYEQIDDSRYGGSNNGLIFEIPEGYAGVVYSPEEDLEGYWIDLGDGLGYRRM